MFENGVTYSTRTHTYVVAKLRGQLEHVICVLEWSNYLNKYLDAFMFCLNACMNYN